MGEPAIAKNAYYAFEYAIDVLDGRFKLGEPAIAKDGWRAATYNEQFGTNLLS